ncbi:MAG: S-layer homology domain-containing protein [Anaerovoracaceae bacterium]
MMKRFQALILALVLCVGLTVPAFAAGGQYEQITIGDVVFEAAYKETVTLNLEDPYDFDNPGPKAQTVTVCVVKPGSQITITGTNGKTEFSRQVGTYSYDSKRDVYTVGWASEIYTGKAENSLSIFTVPVLLQLNDCFVRLGDDAASTKPSESVVYGFTDVKASAYYADAVKWAVERKVTEGTSASTFSPEQTCTNAQILTFIWRSCTISTEDTQTNDTDAPYYKQAVEWASLMNMIDASAFDVNKPCTRAMTVEYFWKMVGSPKTELTSKFTDVSADASYAQAVAWAVENGITSGTSATTFSPDETCTRGQIVTFLHRVMK